MTHTEVKTIARRVFDDLTARHSHLPPPQLEVVGGVLANSAYIGMAHNPGRIEVFSAEFAHPEVVEADVAWVVAHELGHWHHRHSVGFKSFARLHQVKDFELAVYAWDRDSYRRAYRETLLESYADHFAAAHGYRTDIFRYVGLMEATFDAAFGAAA